MTDDDRSGFATLMCALGEAFNEPVSDVRMEVYFAALRDLELPQLATAVENAVRFGRFFPRPVELRDAVHGNADDRATLAWSGLLQMVRRCGYWWNEGLQGPLPWPDEATKRAALELYGGWRALCERLPADGPGLAVAAKQFRDTFSAYARRDAVPPAGERELSADEARAALSAFMTPQLKGER